MIAELRPVGGAIFGLMLVFGAGRIVMLGTIDLFGTRIIQESMFEKLPQDGASENGGYPISAPGRASVTNNYRAEILQKKPDLARPILRTWPLWRSFALYRFVHAALRREDAVREASYAEALPRASARVSS